MKKMAPLLLLALLTACPDDTLTVTPPEESASATPSPEAPPSESAPPEAPPSPTVPEATPAPVVKTLAKPMIDTSKTEQALLLWEPVEGATYQVFEGSNKISTSDLTKAEFALNLEGKEMSGQYQIKAYQGEQLVAETDILNLTIAHSLTSEANCPVITVYDTYQLDTPTGPHTLKVLKTKSDMIPTTSVSGLVFNDLNQVISDADISIKLSKDDLCVAQPTLKTSADGSYIFEGVPTGIPLEITASKQGLNRRTRQVTLKENPDQLPGINRFDFGNNGIDASYSPAALGLSNEPDVLAFDASAAEQGTFKLTFSERMDQRSVEDHFAIRAFNRAKLTVDQRSTVSHTLDGPGQLTRAAEGTKIWDTDSFDTDWNLQGTEVTFTLKPGKALPQDKNRALLYQASFAPFDGKAAEIKDFFGFTRTNNFFNLEGKQDPSVKFEVAKDTTPPRLDSVSLEGHDILLHFSEPMAHYTHDQLLMAGMGLNADAASHKMAGTPETNLSQAKTVAYNYKALVINAKGQFIYDKSLFDALGQAYLNPANPTEVRIVLEGASALKSWLTTGNTLRIQVVNAIEDPAGNALNTQTSQRDFLIP